jgi:hypothetical protein
VTPLSLLSPGVSVGKSSLFALPAGLGALAEFFVGTAYTGSALMSPDVSVTSGVI